MAGDAATNAAESVRPKREHLDRIDHPAADNTWHDAPDLSKGALTDKLHDYYKGNPKEDLRAATAEGTSQAYPAGTSGRGDLATSAGSHHQTDASSGADVVGGAAATKDAVGRRAQDNIDDETKDKAKARKDEYRERTKNYLSRKMPHERRDQTIWRLKV